MTPEELKDAVESAVLNAMTTWARAAEIQAIQQGTIRKGVVDGTLDVVRSAEGKATYTGFVKDGVNAAK